MKKIFLIFAFSVLALSGCSKHAEKKHLPVLTKTEDQGVSITQSPSQSDPSSVYMNGLGYFAERDPQTQEPTIQDFVIANFNSHNRVQWENTSSHDLFTLIKIDNPVYDDQGVIISGDLHWGKQAFN